jgi:hypothetical protein
MNGRMEGRKRIEAIDKIIPDTLVSIRAKIRPMRPTKTEDAASPSVKMILMT